MQRLVCEAMAQGKDAVDPDTLAGPWTRTRWPSRSTSDTAADVGTRQAIPPGECMRTRLAVRILAGRMSASNGTMAR